ncbi:coniferyl-alcohol dehydrogenase [Phaeobacter sp. HF9A]|uniref:coniferyl-alcohol dehydrogenase n=1 Tax=Phaeobacter sp. HF9A TaxID=2721561 RepID=UPI001430090B|nr:coniferyl-alcohol dehydrogenase [Phaeobacter sp. HF9A]NIZ12277.1 coniferyl-alcohol dehydrogenase [Phaeobacter sp. HF9A]
MLFGKTIVVTGVASGIGRRTAEMAGQMGATVIGIDRSPPEQSIGQVLIGDLSTPKGVAAIADALPERFDGLCNVAGLSGQSGAAETLAVNFFGLRALTETLAPKIREGGSVVNVASIAGFGWRQNAARAAAIARTTGFPDAAQIVADHDIPNDAGYPVSKEILLVWTMLAAHQAHFKNRGIRVNAVSPGPVETPILQQFREVLGDARVNADVEAVGRAGTAEDIAPAILFLCSDAARWINGTNIATDGGLEAAVTASAYGF